LNYDAFQFPFLGSNRNKTKLPKVTINFESGRFEQTSAPLTRFSVIADDHSLEEKLFQILKGQLSYVLFSKED
jgi:hypothetical protein